VKSTVFSEQGTKVTMVLPFEAGSFPWINDFLGGDVHGRSHHTQHRNASARDLVDTFGRRGAGAVADSRDPDVRPCVDRWSPDSARPIASSQEIGG
jgi:hypothetical protein